MIFIDTGPLLARHLARDKYFQWARAHLETLERERDRLFTSNFVLDEFFTLLGRKTTYAFAAERARSIYGSERLEILRPVHEDELRAVSLFAKYADQGVSFTDCISFALMRRARLRKVLTLDSHFILAGFEKI